MKRPLSVPVLAALLFGAFAALAAASLYPVMTRFAAEAGIDEWVFIAVPSLLAGLFAFLIYRGAAARVRGIAQSLTRGLLVAVFTWIAFSLLVTWAWCIPSLFAACLSHTLMLSGVLGGGQLLLGSLAAAAITGYAIRTRAARSPKAKD
jgi:hypothetical protein